MRYRLLAPCVALLLYGCGNGTVCFGGSDCGNNNDDEERTVTVEGNIDTVNPPNAVRDLVVFAYTGLKNPSNEPPFEPAPFTDFKFGESAIVADDDTFKLTNVGRGDITIVFLLDDPDPDGSIDCTPTPDAPTEWTCDDCTVLLDDGDLSDVSGGRRVTIEDMDVNFGTSRCPNGEPIIANCGCSKAQDIVISRDSQNGGSSNTDGN